MKVTTIVLAGLLSLPTLTLHAQVRDDSVPVMAERELDGPRIGFMYVTGVRADSLLSDNHLKPFMSVFGWHFEQMVRPRAGGPALVLQQVLVVAGVDQGTAIPSGSFLVGIRFPGGFEFGMGPNISPVGMALAMGIGKSIRYGGVTIPINLAFVRSQGSLRMAILVGYAIRRR